MNRNIVNRLLPAAQGAGRFAEPARSLAALPWLTLSLGFAFWLMEILPQASGLLQYDRAAIACGEYWRLFTGHWTHWNGEHFLWDVVVFVSLGAICEGYGKRAYLAFLAAGSLLISLAVWFGLPQMQLYRGLSGLDAGLYLMVLVIFVRERGKGSSPLGLICFTVLLAAFFAKVGYELFTGEMVFVQDSRSFVPVPLAHLAGAAVGAAAALLAGKVGKKQIGR